MGSSHSAVSRNEPTTSSMNEKASPSSNQSFTSTKPMTGDGSISLRNVDGWEDKMSKDPKVQLARTILVDTDYKTALASRSTRVADPHVFNLQLDFKTDPITSQKSSGRCWLFATTNVLRYSVMQKLNLKEFQLSQVRARIPTVLLFIYLLPYLQSYLFMWDKLNKSNYYLECSIETAHLPLDDRLVAYLNKELISDGGQWDMAVNLLEVGL